MDTEGCIGRAVSVAEQYNHVELVTDEAELLRGCLFALIAIAQIQWGGEAVK